MTATTPPPVAAFRTPVSRRREPRVSCRGRRRKLGKSHAVPAWRADAGAMANRPWRMHDAKSTGSRTPKWLAVLAGVRPTHGDHDAAPRAIYRTERTVIVRPDCRRRRVGSGHIFRSAETAFSGKRHGPLNADRIP